MIPWLAIGRLLIRRETIVVVAIVGGWVLFNAWRDSLVREGEQRAGRRALADRYFAETGRQDQIIAGLDAALRRNTARFDSVTRRLTVTLAANASLAQRLRANPTDTVLVVEYLAQTDTLRAECEACQATARAMRDTAGLAIAERDDARSRLRAMTDSLVGVRSPERGVVGDRPRPRSRLASLILAWLIALVVDRAIR